jgi:hypothetical protein
LPKKEILATTNIVNDDEQGVNAMSGTGKRFAKSRYTEDGLRATRDRSHYEKLNEKHLRSALHSKSFALVEDDSDDNDYVPFWRDGE